MVAALAFIEITGEMSVRFLGARAGTVMTGFFGGLVSSTALTASLSRKSREMSERNLKVASLSFLSATLAMLVQALVLLVVGLDVVPMRLMILFLGPIGMTVVLIVYSSSKLPSLPRSDVQEVHGLDWVSILKLTIFIVGILALAKFLQNLFGRNGLEILTFLVSLFEIHGSVIANVQLYDMGLIDAWFLGKLVTLSLTASYISKFFLVSILGNSFLKRRITLWTGLVLLSLGISWLAFHFSSSHHSLPFSLFRSCGKP